MNESKMTGLACEITCLLLVRCIGGMMPVPAQMVPFLCPRGFNVVEGVVRRDESPQSYHLVHVEVKVSYGYRGKSLTKSSV